MLQHQADKFMHALKERIEFPVFLRGKFSGIEVLDLPGNSSDIKPIEKHG